MILLRTAARMLLVLVTLVMLVMLVMAVASVDAGFRADAGDRIADEPGLIIAAQLFPEELAGHFNSEVSGTVGDLGESIVLCQADLMAGAGLLFVGRLAGFGDDCLAGCIGVATSFVQHSTNLVSGFGQSPLIGSQHQLGILVCGLGGRDHVGDALLPLVESVHDRLPGKLRQQAEQAEKNDERPDGKVGLEPGRALEVLLRCAGRRIVADLRQMAMVAVSGFMVCVRGVGMLGIGRERGPTEEPAEEWKTAQHDRRCDERTRCDTIAMNGVYLVQSLSPQH